MSGTHDSLASMTPEVDVSDDHSGFHLNNSFASRCGYDVWVEFPVRFAANISDSLECSMYCFIPYIGDEEHTIRVLHKLHVRCPRAGARRVWRKKCDHGGICSHACDCQL